MVSSTSVLTFSGVSTRSSMASSTKLSSLSVRTEIPAQASGFFCRVEQ